jgi:putative aldouronate transport system permease protein
VLQILHQAALTKNRYSPATKIMRKIRTNWLLMLMLLPGLIMLAVFKIGPVLGMIISFQDFSAFKGIQGSPWVGLKHFRTILKDPYITVLVKNTILLALYSLLFSFPLPVIFALMLNEIRYKFLKISVQAISFLPFLISSAVMVSIMYTLLSPSSGVINHILNLCGIKSIFFMAEPEWFRPIYVTLQVWQTFGYSAIVYIAAMATIDPSLYESAEMDGIGRLKKIFYITLPSISNTVIVMLIISVGNIFTVDLDRILLMYNQSVYETADVIQTYVYRIGFANIGFPDYSYGTAVNLLKSVFAFILILITNKIANTYSDSKIF